MPTVAEGAEAPAKKTSARRPEKTGGGGKSRRERLESLDPNAPLVKPAEVAAPGEAANNAAIQALKDKIAAGEEQIVKIDAEIQVLRGVREKQNAATKAKSAELREFRQTVRAAQQNKDKLSEQLGLLSEKKKKASEALKAQRKAYKTTDAASIDALIAEIQKQLETSTLDLKTEKEKVHEIKKLTAQKDSIKELAVAADKVKAQEQEHEALYTKLKEAKQEVQTLRAREREMIAELDAAKVCAVDADAAGAAVGDANSQIEALMSKKAEVIQSNRDARTGIKEKSTLVKIQFAEYREYQRAMAAYKDKLDLLEEHKRREADKERYNKMKQERKEKEAQQKEAKKRQEARMLAVANGCQIYVGGLALRAAEADLRSVCEPFGTITDAMVVRDSDTDLSRGFAFVTFDTETMARDAIKQLNRKELPVLCPPHGTLSLKLADKSRQQKEWEKANPSKCPPKKGSETKEAGEGEVKVGAQV